jgi:hypothetical protein
MIRTTFGRSSLWPFWSEHQFLEEMRGRKIDDRLRVPDRFTTVPTRSCAHIEAGCARPCENTHNRSAFFEDRPDRWTRLASTPRSTGVADDSTPIQMPPHRDHLAEYD